MPTFERYVGDILADSPRVRALMLNGRREKIGDEGARRLAASLLTNTRMNRIFLGRNNITPAGASALANALLRTSAPVAHFTSITNSVEDGGALSFAETLRTNSSVVSLRLEGAGIRTAGAVALAGALRENSTLQDLNLCANFIGAEAVVAFLNGMRRTDDVKDTLNGVLDGNHTLHSLKVDWLNGSGNPNHMNEMPPETVDALTRLTAILAINKHGPKMARRMKIGRLIDSNPLSVVCEQLQLHNADAKLVPEVLAAVGRSASLGSMLAIVKQMPTLFDKLEKVTKPVRPTLRPLKQATHQEAVRRKRPQLHSLKHTHPRPLSPPTTRPKSKRSSGTNTHIVDEGVMDKKSGIQCLLCEWGGSIEESIVDRKHVQNCAKDHSQLRAKSRLNSFRLCIRI